ncbi:hypothetical protein HELRODRAFT_164701 [Helobdella robusta]|uniref:G-protein coupled receptors family 1 profile domain-containing protein n=1 Tax=Helobdella robusta TaxID=6412 RepID=T1EVR0_HELRO|nr:hypothetical protein HELRODRAFT_164701 [Helobdella robusta]ESN92625.1 hypothetical protein HELRODRAFT_164701 [Helobdella robusta]
MSGDLEHELAAYLWLIISPILLIAGICGNFLSLVVLASRPFRKSSAAFGLSTLAVVDSGVLFVSLLRHWVFYLSGDKIDVRTLFGSYWWCNLHVFLTYYLNQLSSWTLVLVTVERAVSVIAPLMVRSRFTRGRTVCAWFVISGLIFSINVHFFWTVEYEEEAVFQSFVGDGAGNGSSGGAGNGGGDVYYDGDDVRLIATAAATVATDSQRQCYFNRKYAYFTNVLWPWIDFVLCVALPFLVIAFSNLAMAYCVWKTMKIRSAKPYDTRYSQKMSLGFI